MSKIRKKRPRARLGPSPKPPNEHTQSAHILRWAFFASGWIFAALVWVLELPAKVVSFEKNVAAAQNYVGTLIWNYERYEGRWTSDPDAAIEKNLISDGESVVDTGDVQLSITSLGNGAFEGELLTKDLAENFAPWSRVLLTGTVGVGGFNGEAWDVVGGEHRTIARFRLVPRTRDGTTLRLEPSEDGAKIFPDDVTLWHTSREMAPGQFGKRYFQLINQVVRGATKSAEKEDMKENPETGSKD